MLKALMLGAGLLTAAGAANAQAVAPATGAQATNPSVSVQAGVQAGSQTADTQATTASTASSAAGAVTAATKADVTTGATVVDPQGGTVGKIEAVNANGAVVATGKVRAQLPFTSFGKSDKGLVIAVTKTQLEAAAKAKS